MNVIEFVKNSIPPSWKSTPSGWVSGNCPMCVERGENRPDTKRRGGFHFDDDKFQYNCFNCGFATGWSSGKQINDRLRALLVKFGVEIAQIQRVNLELMKEQETLNIAAQFLNKETVDDFVNVNWTEYDLPPGSKLFKDVDTSTLTEKQLDNFVQCVQYIHDRHLDFYDNWYWTPETAKPYFGFDRRVILPFYHTGKTVGFTARVVGAVNKGVPKYWLKSPKNFVFNLDSQTGKKYTIVTEGQLDALYVGGVAIGGNDPSKTQVNIIDHVGTEIIVLPDADKASMKLVNKAVRMGWSVSFPEWDGCKDAGDAVEKYGRLFTVRSILESAINNPTKIEILAKGYCK